MIIEGLYLLTINITFSHFSIPPLGSIIKGIDLEITHPC